VTSGTAVYVLTFSNSSLIINPFGLSTGPDGNIYVSSLGTLSTGGNGVVTNDNGQITEINATTGAMSTFLTDNNISYGATTGDAPKYLSFNATSVVFVPEPGSIVLTGMGLHRPGQATTTRPLGPRNRNALPLKMVCFIRSTIQTDWL
jgi:hypothetical protein